MKKHLAIQLTALPSDQDEAIKAHEKLAAIAMGLALEGIQTSIGISIYDDTEDEVESGHPG